ncbi:MAG: heterodisulfide reductase-related iron-sulfur binding cluster [Ignavibacterium sp.]
MNKNNISNELLKFLPNDDILSQCIHCGMCLSTCPTYDLTKFELSSPRGRIKLVKSFAKGEIELTNTFIEEMNFCLDCQACETACPAGVKYGSIVESARNIISKSNKEKFFYHLIKKFSLNQILTKIWLLKLVSRILYVYQKSGLRTFISKIKLLKIISPKLFEIEKLAPQISDYFSDEVIKEINLPQNEIKQNTAIHLGCIMNVAFTDINIDTVEVLLKNNCKVISPKNQICCGSLHAHYGEMDKAIELAKRNIDLYSKYEYDYLVSNSAGCGAFMKEYEHILSEDEKYKEKAKIFSSKVKDISEFLSIINLKFNSKEINKTITYDDACHLCHTQKITKEPRDVIKSIPGIKYVELKEASWCCGSAGIYNVVQYDSSMNFLNRKIKHIKDSNADIVLSANPGCLIQIKYGIEKNHLETEVMHPITLINKVL